MAFTIAAILQSAKIQLTASSETPSLDAEILLAYVLDVSRSYLLAFSEQLLTQQQVDAFQTLMEQRKRHVPIAYLTGHREFWSLDFMVTSDTLIPRPETELLVEIVLQAMEEEGKTIADLGTGSGAIALAIAEERPSWRIYATDVSPKALHIAMGNADRLHLTNVIFREGVWCKALPDIQFDAIVSNPPYISPSDPHLQRGALLYEPPSALISEENGLYDIRCIIHEAKHYLKKKGFLLLEHGADQAEPVRKLFTEFAYTQIKSYQDLEGRERATLGIIC